MSNEAVYHTPVLLKESVDGMEIAPDNICIDVTFGGGGHSREILGRLGKKGHLYSFDQDEDAEKNAPEDKRFTFVRGNFRFIYNFMHYYGHTQVDAILADLGVSGHHFDDETRGFSFRFDAALDMRMNKRGGETAASLLNRASEEELARIFKLYGELNCARKLAARIVKARSVKPFERVNELIEVAKPFCPPQREKKEMAKVFQALRIEINKEVEALQEMLVSAKDLLKPGGRLSVITYHSIEDRIVKNFMKSGNFDGEVEKDFFGRSTSPFETKKVIVPTDEEMERNPRSRSAKLRIAIKREEMP
ncbi:MAG: 16S rRNA (cytosine(1402)-N(4))-methyltransferase RsmH [Bacteroidaceae bacterium]|nr:16S rRNA (cytosine(1402)-N(4))-methyltransferase RsmH [Bacteroidaceae bacterium]